MQKSEGSFLCISLLEGFVFQALLDYFFSPKKTAFVIEGQKLDYELRITALQTSWMEQSKFTPFAVQIFASEKRRLWFRESLETEWQEYAELKSLQKHIADIQVHELFKPQMTRFDFGQTFTLHSTEEIEKIPRYSVTVIDHHDEQALAQKKVGVFVIPKGQDRHMELDKFDNQRNLVEQANFARLIIVKLGMGHTFVDLAQIQKQLDPRILALVPGDCTNKEEIPYLSTGQNLSQYEVIFESADNAVFVEDSVQQINGKDVVLRQLYFSQKPNQIQAEITISYMNAKNKSYSEKLRAQSVYAPSKKNKKVVFDFDWLQCEYHQTMVAGLNLVADHWAKRDDPIDVLVCGTGAGIFPMFLRHNLRDRLKSLVTVDISQQVLQVAESYFGFDQEAPVHSVCADAYKFIEEQGPKQFDALFMDVNFEEDNVAISPPLRFLQPEFVQRTLDLVKDNGYVAFNLLIEEKKDLDMVLGFIREVKGARKFITKAIGEKNYVLMMVKGEEGKIPPVDAFKTSERRINSFKNLVKTWSLKKDLFESTDMKFLYYCENMSEVKNK